MIARSAITVAEALTYHLEPSPGKYEVIASTPMLTQRDLSLAYSPGVAVPVEAIAADHNAAYDYTVKGNMVAVITNGTAILGLGNLGALASKPVMEGKAALFKHFAGVNAIDIELDTEFGRRDRPSGPNNATHIWRYKSRRYQSSGMLSYRGTASKILDIPVFHDDQHGTAVIVAAALINALELAGKKIEDAKIVVNGAGAAGIACLKLLKYMGAAPESCILCDSKGPIWYGRIDGMNRWKSEHMTKTAARTLEEAVEGADVFIGLSVKGALNRRMVESMAVDPIIFCPCKSRSGDHSRRSEGDPHGCYRRDRAIRLPKSGQQRPLLSVSVSRGR